MTQQWCAVPDVGCVCVSRNGTASRWWPRSVGWRPVALGRTRQTFYFDRQIRNCWVALTGYKLGYISGDDHVLTIGVDLAAAVKDTEFGRGVVLARSVALQSRSHGRSPKVGETRAQPGTTPPAAEKRRRGRFRKPRTGWGRTSALVAALQCSPHTRLAAFRASRSVRRAG